jgi:hypothetical protein
MAGDLKLRRYTDYVKSIYTIRTQVMDEFHLEPSTILTAQEIADHVEAAIRQSQNLLEANDHHLHLIELDYSIDLKLDASADGTYTNAKLQEAILGAHVL